MRAEQPKKGFLPLLLRSLGTYWSRPASIRGAAPLQYFSLHKLKSIKKKVGHWVIWSPFAWSEQGLKWRKMVTFSNLTFLLLTFALEFTLKLYRSKSCYQITISLTQRCSFFSKTVTFRLFQKWDHESVSHKNKWIHCSWGSSLVAGFLVFCLKKLFVSRNQCWTIGGNLKKLSHATRLLRNMFLEFDPALKQKNHWDVA